MLCHQLAKSGSEHGEQRAFMQYMAKYMPTVAEVTFAIPNGAALGARGGGKNDNTARIRGAKLKAEGMKSGVPDVMVAWPLNRWDSVYGQPQMAAGLFIEMKIEGGSVSDNQKLWRKKLTERGYVVETAYSWIDAVKAVHKYFNALAPINWDNL